MARPAWCREQGEALVIALHVQPGAKRTEAAGAYGEGPQARLKIRLAAPPVDGKANAALVEFVAAAFGVPRSRVTLVRGESSRDKTVHIEAPTRRPDWCA